MVFPPMEKKNGFRMPGDCSQFLVLWPPALRRGRGQSSVTSTCLWQIQYPFPWPPSSHIYHHIRQGRNYTSGDLTDFTSSEMNIQCSGELSLFANSVCTQWNSHHDTADRTNWLACTSKIHLCVGDKLHILSNKSIAKTDFKKREL